MNMQLLRFSMAPTAPYIESILAEIAGDTDTLEAIGRVCDLLGEIPSPKREQLFVSIARLGCKSIRPLN